MRAVLRNTPERDRPFTATLFVTVIVTDKLYKQCWLEKRADFRNKKANDHLSDADAGAFVYMACIHQQGVSSTLGWKQAASMPQPVITCAKITLYRRV